MIINDYKNEMVSAVEEYVSNYEKLEKETADVESNLRDHKVKLNSYGGSATPAYIAEVNYISEKAKALRKEMDTYKDDRGYKLTNDLNRIRDNAIAFINDKYKANPADFDAPVLEIVKSGICKPEELESFIAQALKKNNFTMARIIGSHAKAESEKYADSDKELSRKYSLVSTLATTANGNNNIRAIDEFISVLGRVIRTPKLYRDSRIYEILNEYSFGNF